MIDNTGKWVGDPTGWVGPQGPQAKYGGVAVVAKSGGDYTDPVAAMADIATWGWHTVSVKSMPFKDHAGGL